MSDKQPQFTKRRYVYVVLLVVGEARNPFVMTRRVMAKGRVDAETRGWNSLLPKIQKIGGHFVSDVAVRA